jgi:heat-inducible transcriptional repressor
MTERQKQLLESVIDLYIGNAQPVGSSFLADGEFEVSGATIRNDLRALEEEGFLTHTHTSSGRIPTEVGYEYYIENCVKEKKLPKSVENKLLEFYKEEVDREKSLKILAKGIANLLNLTVIINIENEQIYYAGLSNFFSHHEFSQNIKNVNLQNIFDNLEENSPKIFTLLEELPVCLVGSKNPLSSNCTIAITKISNNSFFGILGPTRFPYKKVVPIINFINDKLK